MSFLLAQTFINYVGKKKKTLQDVLYEYKIHIQAHDISACHQRLNHCQMVSSPL